MYVFIYFYFFILKYALTTNLFGILNYAYDNLVTAQINITIK